MLAILSNVARHCNADCVCYFAFNPSFVLDSSICVLKKGQRERELREGADLCLRPRPFGSRDGVGGRQEQGRPAARKRTGSVQPTSLWAALATGCCGGAAMVVAHPPHPSQGMLAVVQWACQRAWWRGLGGGSRSPSLC